MTEEQKIERDRIQGNISELIEAFETYDNSKVLNMLDYIAEEKDEGKSTSFR